MKKFIFLLPLFLGICFAAVAQVTGELNVLDRDVAYIQYTPPIAATDDFDYQRLSTRLNLPPMMGEKLSVFPALGLDVHNFSYKDDAVDRAFSELDQFYNINLSIFSQYKFSDKWSLNGLMSPFLLSNFAGGLSSDDFDFNGYIFAEKTFMRKKGGYLMLDFGVGYLTLNGTTTVNPIINLKGRLNEEWSFVLGLPNTYVKWDLHSKHSLKVLGEINDFSANLSSSNEFAGLTDVDRAVFTTISAGLEYNFWATPTLGIMLRAVQPVFSDYELRDSNEDAIQGFEADFDLPMISFGVKFNPIRALQNDLKPL